MKRFFMVGLIGCLSTLIMSIPASAEPMAEVFTGSWDNIGTEIDYTLSGGDVGQLYSVTATATGCVGVGVPMNLTGPTASGSVDVICNTASGTGSVVVRFYKGAPGGTLVRTMVFTFACAAGCNITLTDSTEIPTLSEWALIIFSVLLLGLMTYFVIRKRRAAVVGI